LKKLQSNKDFEKLFPDYFTPPEGTMKIQLDCESIVDEKNNPDIDFDQSQ
jgi:hypothetical protein